LRREYCEESLERRVRRRGEREESERERRGRGE